MFEGFLTVLLKERVKIVELLESESNQQNEDDKFNRVDIKAKNSNGEIILVEIQQSEEYYYLQRMVYGVAKTITEHITKGEKRKAKRLACRKVWRKVVRKASGRLSGKCRRKAIHRKR